MSAITTTANGTYTDCGLGQPVTLALTCGGPSCGILSQFPHLICGTDPISSLTSCNNSVPPCPQAPNFVSTFQLQQQQNNVVNSQQQLVIDGQNFQGTDNGGVVNYSGPSSSASGSGTGTVPSGTGGSTPLGTATGTGAGSSGTSTTKASGAVSAASSRRPAFSKAFLVLFVILGMFVGQSTANVVVSAEISCTSSKPPVSSTCRSSNPHPHPSSSTPRIVSSPSSIPPEVLVSSPSSIPGPPMSPTMSVSTPSSIPVPIIIPSSPSVAPPILPSSPSVATPVISVTPVPPTPPSVTVVTPPPTTITTGPTPIVTTPSPTTVPLATINTNIQILSDINGLFPTGYASLLQQVESSLCQSAVLPAVSSVVNGQISRARGVVNVIQACVQFIDAAESKTDPAQIMFELALGNIVLCDKFSNSVLEGPLVQGHSPICNVIIPAIPA